MAHAYNSSYLGGWDRRITWTQEVEVAVSRECAIALQPGQQEWNSISKKKKNKTKSEIHMPLGILFYLAILKRVLECLKRALNTIP